MNKEVLAQVIAAASLMAEKHIASSLIGRNLQVEAAIVAVLIEQAIKDPAFREVLLSKK